MKIIKGDNVLVVAGKDRGKKGKVLRVFPKTQRVLVEGVLMRKKHVKPKKGGEKGQTIEQPSSLHISNVEMLCPTCGKGVRLGYKVEGEKKIRICVTCRTAL